MFEDQMARRGFVKKAAGMAGLAAGFPLAACGATASSEAPAATATGDLKLGVASYSLRKFSREQAIEMVKALRTEYIHIKSMHLPYELSAAEAQAAAGQFQAAGLQIVGGGVITFEEDSDDGVRKYFEYARNASMPLMAVTGPVGIWPRVERFATEYDIRVAIHNHGPEDERYPTPYEALEQVDGMDPRMGVCIDVGHTARTGIDLVKSIADAGSRLLDMHMKDLRSFDGHTDVIVGRGAMPVPEIFAQLLAMKFGGQVNLEYELDADDPLPGMQQSFAYMRGLLSGLTGGART